MKENTELLALEELRVDFATSGGTLQAVRGVSFQVDQGEIVGVVGESGSGKSVTAHSILRLLPGNGAITGGRILYRGEDIARLKAPALRRYRGKEAAMIFQEPGRSFDPLYTVGASLRETLRAHAPEMSPREARERSIRLLEEVKVPDPARRLDNFPYQFSGGLLQRIMIAHALAAEPALLIADEPTTALDVTIQAGIIELLLELRRKRNLAILFITHNLALISEFADRLVVMYAGIILEEGPPGEVLARPGHPYTEALLGGLVPLGAHHRDGPLRGLAGSPPDPLAPEEGCPFAPRCPLVTAQCRRELPPWRREGQSSFRCLVPGPKGPDLRFPRVGENPPGGSAPAEGEGGLP
ncbi:peptide/nickel transport system ATP-binding protein/oligopeptide transport system ATP-binding protein [Alkalispirochaeta americana]|uniref:Peptide/nickel transport system ATP-binding protein/oligopeptide transport system ATP-binding protein n=1 Tax=Alkalispirochaeta americana TaxID=159291 RepID=A0A1N6RCX2_9SPIO|nr:ABC transporter ATP-binding protein [Alkalispirochaeta americana]SIQ26708.1 peptide/nickel transport system ATP-binding protein/oligopeptide transport system ATP-binding protein [Alkalispirochaeta americana]